MIDSIECKERMTVFDAVDGHEGLPQRFRRSLVDLCTWTGGEGVGSGGNGGGGGDDGLWRNGVCEGG